ncbi:hypothetical protein RND81_12G181000 [Saponaria officinalis]|uniref:Uncharacterized protein n=1 Tax=Saponaria officinalis TaxID=3572 RepID=A0AAW1HC56_SAPOF
MAPSSRRREKTTTTTTTTKKSTPTSSNRRIITRSIYKKQQLLLSQQTTITTPTKKIVHPTCDLTPTPNTDNINNASFVDGCSTPKSEKYKIPAIVTCPPAPKKPKVSSKLAIKLGGYPKKIGLVRVVIIGIVCCDSQNIPLPPLISLSLQF